LDLDLEKKNKNKNIWIPNVKYIGGDIGNTPHPFPNPIQACMKKV
jgi:hypothetical protein